ncbi:sarcosine oxidase [Halobacteriales archaeon QS_8_69_26]|nr:MAG: sarcosine oxidase [Halobacteriales archaeon QS_8_69_26]
MAGDPESGKSESPGDPPAESGPTVAVVGAGAVGTTAAYDLAMRGADVTLYDRGSVGAGATGRAAGVCYDAFARAVDGTLAERSLERFRALSGSGDVSFEECPYVWLARSGDPRRVAAVREGLVDMERNGRDVTEVDPDDLADRFPVLWTEDVGVAAVTTNAGRTDPGSYAELLADRARRAGAEVVPETPVAVRTDPARVVVDGEDRAVDAVLVAAGAHTPGLLADAGIGVPVKPYRVQALTATLGADGGVEEYGAPMVYDATGGFYVRPHPEGLLAGDGTEEVEADPDDYDADADRGFREGMVGRIRSRLRLSPEVSRAWAGLCTATPDRDPLLGRVAEGVHVATGWQGHGFMRALATGEAVAGAILRGDPAPVEAFDPRRFDGDEEFEIREGMAIEEN